MSQGRMKRVKAALRTRTELCAIDDLYRDALHNGRNDLAALSRVYGWAIERTWATHGEVTHRHYRLMREGRPTRPPRQLELSRAT